MSGSTTLSIRLAPKTKQRLGRLARQTKRTKSFLAGEAIESYVERELAVVEGIERALADAKSGNVVTHDAAMRRVRATIARAKRTKNSAR